MSPQITWETTKRYDVTLTEWMGISVNGHHSNENYLSDFKEMQVLCTSTLSCAHYCLLLFAKIDDGHIKIRPEYVGVITNKTFYQHNFVHFLVRIVWNTAILRIYFFSALLYNTPCGRSKKTCLDWNWMGVTSFRSAHNHKLLRKNVNTVQQNRRVSLVAGKEISSQC
jgi:hypothetical protein